MIINLVSSIIRMLEFAMFARAIMSWFPQTQGTKISEFLFMITEPMIVPFRNLLSRFQIMRSMPIDISFLCTFIALEFLQMFLYRLS